MKAQQVMRPLDVVVLLKIISMGEKSWSQVSLADELFMSQSEISQSVACQIKICRVIACFRQIGT